MARSMVARWGMTEELGPVDLRQSEDHPFLGQSIARPREHADDTAARVDAAVIDLLKVSEAEATRIIEGHRDRLLALVRELEEREVLEFDAIEACLSPGKRKTGAREKA